MNVHIRLKIIITHAGKKSLFQFFITSNKVKKKKDQLNSGRGVCIRCEARLDEL